MTTTESTIASETRPLSHFERVVLRAQHDNELLISQGETESLTIEAPSEILERLESKVSEHTLLIELGGSWAERFQDAVTTSLTRPHIRYHLKLRKLEDLEVFAMAHVRIDQLKTPRLSLKFHGAGDINIASLQTPQLEVDQHGVGRVEIAGQATEQHIHLSGPGRYHAPKLESHKANVEVKGPGQATLWATDLLDVKIQGIGGVSYYGSPKLSEHIAPMGCLVHLR